MEEGGGENRGKKTRRREENVRVGLFWCLCDKEHDTRQEAMQTPEVFGG